MSRWDDPSHGQYVRDIACPMLVTLNLGKSDDWLRLMIRGHEGPPQGPLIIQQVIVESAREGQRIMDRMATLKHAKGLPYGGGWMQRWTR